MRKLKYDTLKKIITRHGEEIAISYTFNDVKDQPVTKEKYIDTAMIQARIDALRAEGLKLKALKDRIAADDFDEIVDQTKGG